MENQKFATVTGELRLLSQTSEWYQKVELWLLNDKKNENDWIYKNLDEHRSQFQGTPILIAYVGDKIGDGHNFTEIRNPDGSVTASFMGATSERIVGYFPDDAEIRLQVRDDKTWVVGVGYIWKWYAQELVKKIKEQGLDGFPISIETLIEEGYMEGTTEIFTKWVVLGTTILGLDVAPAVKDASIKALSALTKNEVRTITQLRVASENKKAKNESPKTNQTKGVTKMVTVKELQKQLPDFRVLAVNGEAAALLSDHGEPYFCSAKMENGEVIVGSKVALNKVIFVCDDATIEVDAAKIVSVQNARCEKAENDFRVEHEARVNAETELEKMKKNEKERRRKALKDAVNARFEAINANRAEKLDASIIADICTDENVEKYVDMEDSDGAFCGEKAICGEVDSRCMNKILEADAARANSKKKSFVWDDPNKNGVSSEDDIFAAARKMANK